MVCLTCYIYSPGILLWCEINNCCFHKRLRIVNVTYLNERRSYWWIKLLWQRNKKSRFATSVYSTQADKYHSCCCNQLRQQRHAYFLRGFVQVICVFGILTICLPICINYTAPSTRSSEGIKLSHDGVLCEFAAFFEAKAKSVPNVMRWIIFIYAAIYATLHPFYLLVSWVLHTAVKLKSRYKLYTQK